MLLNAPRDTEEEYNINPRYIIKVPGAKVQGCIHN